MPLAASFCATEGRLDGTDPPHQSKGLHDAPETQGRSSSGCAALLLLAACGNSASNSAANSSTSAAAGAAAGSSPRVGGIGARRRSPRQWRVHRGGGPTKNPATDGQTINVLMVNNPQMIDLQSLTAANFTAQTGITVNYTVLPENDMRNKAALEFKNQAGQYDVTTLSNFEIPIYAKNDWLTPLSDYRQERSGIQPGRHLPGADRLAEL